MFGLENGGMAPNQGFSGGGTSLADLQALTKAMSAGNITGRETANLTTASGAPLKVESLDSMLKVVTYNEQTIKLWKLIPKKKAYNTVEEFNQLASYGDVAGGSLVEGELPQNIDSTYVRRAQLVKFYGVTGAVTHPMSLVNVQASISNMVEQEVKNKTLWLLRTVNKAMFGGNSDVVGTDFDGLYTQHQKNDAFASLDQYFASEVVVDCRGASLTEANIEKAAEGIVQNYGVGTTLIAPPKVLSKFVQNFYGNKFIPINTEAIRAGEVGQNVQVFQSQYGPIKLEWDVHMNPDSPKTLTAAATSAAAPLAPTMDGTTPIAAVSSDASSMWGSGDAGSYFYAISAINRFGESTLVSASGTATAVVAGGAVSLKFTATASTNAATGFIIYRSNAGATSAAAATYYPLFQVGLSQLTAGYDGGAAGVVRDRNRFMPNTAQAMLIQLDNTVVEFSQLAPLMKMDLAVISPAYRFMVLLYGTPLLYAPKRLVRFVNVGTV